MSNETKKRILDASDSKTVVPLHSMDKPELVSAAAKDLKEMDRKTAKSTDSERISLFYRGFYG